MSELKLIRRRIKTSEDFFKLIVMGDFHIGQQACEEERLKRDIDWIATKNPKNYGVVLLGDLIENVIKGSKGSQFEMSDPLPDSQMDTVVELLTPIKKHIIAMCDGNHEYRTMRDAGVSLTKTMAQRLGLQQKFYDYSCMVELSLERKKKVQMYDIYLEHGAGSLGRTPGARMNKIERAQRQINADIYLMGHVHHKLMSEREVTYKVGNKMVKKTILFATCGSYLIDAEYARRCGFEPTKPGMTRVDLGTTRYDVHCSI